MERGSRTGRDDCFRCWSRHKRARPSKPPRLGRWQQVLADALDQNLAGGVRAAVADHLGRTPTRAERTWSQPSALLSRSLSASRSPKCSHGLAFGLGAGWLCGGTACCPSKPIPTAGRSGLSLRWTASRSAKCGCRRLRSPRAALIDRLFGEVRVNDHARDALALGDNTRVARKSSHVRRPTAPLGARFSPARNARAALPGSQMGRIGRRLLRARR